MHTFDPQIACRVGVNAAVIYANIAWWCEKNRANDKHLHDGRYWTYNSVRAWCDLFPYMSQKQIRTALELLESEGMICVGEYNSSSYDRTKWYSLNGKLDLPYRANGLAPDGEPIPVSKPVIKPEAKASERKPPRRAVQLPEGWVPSERNIADAQAKGLSARDIENEADRFRDHHTARGTAFKDWDAGWRTWIGNAARYRGMAVQPAARGYGQGSSIASIVARRRLEGEV